MTKYIDEKEFIDFKENFKLLVQTLNHNVTDIRDDMNEFKKDIKEFKNQSMEVFSEFKEVKGSMYITNKLMWALLGILTTISGAILISTL